MSDAADGGYRPYPAYKNSGVEWLGEVPEHWEVRAVWTLFSLGRGRVISHEEIHANQGQYPVYSSQTEDEGVMGHLATFDFEGEYLTWTTDGAKAGTVFRREGQFNCTNVCGTLEPSKSQNVDLKYIRDALNNATSWFVRHDINPKLMNNVMARIRVPTPPLPEQHAIAAFLDHKTAEIDTLIAAKERLIALLREKRAALITSAVTKGLDPDVAMKDSGVEWLGEVPGHWEVMRSKRLFSLRNTKALQTDKQVTCSIEHGVIYQDEFMALKGQRVTVVETGADILKHVEPNDFVISMRSFQGGIEWSHIRGCMSSAYVALIPMDGINHRYFSYLLKSKIYIQALQSTSNLVRDGQALRYSNFVQVDLPLPPKEEQERIGQFLMQALEESDSLVERVGEAIDRLKEYRTALISAAVTGKIDVRNL